MKARFELKLERLYIVLPTHCITSSAKQADTRPSRGWFPLCLKVNSDVNTVHILGLFNIIVNILMT
jgi:hypothetical protein